ncbi:MAG: hypothetical protein ACR2HI_06425 [Gaiella sp.]
MAWVDREVAWHDLAVEYCDVTGQLLPRRYWSFDVDGRVLRAAHPRYERLYLEYVLPRMGAARAQESGGSTRTTS